MQHLPNASAAVLVPAPKTSVPFAAPGPTAKLSAVPLPGIPVQPPGGAGPGHAARSMS